MRTTRRGFLGAVAALVTAPAAVIAGAAQTLHLRFTHSKVTQITWGNHCVIHCPEEGYYDCGNEHIDFNPTLYFPVCTDPDCDNSSWLPVAGNNFALEKLT